ncbi:LysR family transcriptional regulator [Pseudomonas putida S11]|nr:LysR family transcriptional regulator [Pseudomonas putida S11]
MTLKQLRYLIAIVEAGSFSNAARHAFIAQPALSRQIGLLESELEMQLLARQHDGIELTDAGRQLYEVARSVIQKLDSVKDELKSSRGNPKGHVAISIPATASALLLPAIITQAQARFPGIKLTVWDGLSREGGQAIELGKVDFGVVPNAEELAHIVAEPVFSEDLYWVGLPAHGPDDSPITLAEAASSRLVMPPRSLHLRRRIEQAAMETGVALDSSYEQQSAPGIASLVRAGLAATISNWPPLLDLAAPAERAADRGAAHHSYDCPGPFATQAIVVRRRLHARPGARAARGCGAQRALERHPDRACPPPPAEPLNAAQVRPGPAQPCPPEAAVGGFSEGPSIPTLSTRQ